MRVVALLALAFVLAGCAMGGTKTTTVTVTRTVTTAAGPGPLGQVTDARYFGTPVRITKLDQQCPGATATAPAFSCYELVITPQFFLVGVTANVAFAEQQHTACQPLECPGVDDDHIVLSAGSQQLHFILPATTTGTVLDAHQKPITVTAAQLSALVAGSPTPKLIEGLASGLWLTVDVDTVTSFAQQFQP